MSEEEAFWMISMLIESFIPLDYYSKMVGAIVDQDVLDKLIEERMPDLWAHFQNADPPF